MILYTLLYLISIIVSVFRNKRNIKFISAIIIVLLAVFAGTRNEGLDNDYREYVRLFSLSVSEGYQQGYEIIFYILPKLFFTLSSDSFVELTFISFAFIGVSAKVIAIKQVSINFVLSILIYIGIFYLGHEFTTIRAGVASGIFLLMLQDVVKNNRKAYFVKVAIALVFHYSSLLFIPIWFILRSKLNIKYYYLILLISFVVVYINFNVLSLLNLEYLIPKVKVYTEIEDELELNPFNFKMLISFLYLLIFMFFYKKGKNDEWFVLLLKLHIISLTVFYLLAQASMAFSLRSFELLSIIQILLLPYLINFAPTKLKTLGYLLIFSTSFLNFYYILYVSNNIKEYSSWLF